MASHADIAANSVINFAELGARALANKSRKQAAKSAKTRGANRQKFQQAFLAAKQEKPKLSARQFALAHHEGYGYQYETVLNYLSKKELDIFIRVNLSDV